MHYCFSRIICGVMGICIMFLSLNAFSDSEDKIVLARIRAVGHWNIGIQHMTVFNDGSVRLFIPNTGDGIYKEVKVNQYKIDKLMDGLKLTGIGDDNLLPSSRFYSVLDGDYIAIDVYIDGEEKSLASLHPFVEKEGYVVFGVEKYLLDENETKEDFLREKTSDEYYRFRKIWDQCFDLLDNFYYEITGKRMVVSSRLESPMLYADFRSPKDTIRYCYLYNDGKGILPECFFPSGYSEPITEIWKDSRIIEERKTTKAGEKTNTGIVISKDAVEIIVEVEIMDSNKNKLKQIYWNLLQKIDGKWKIIEYNQMAY